MLTLFSKEEYNEFILKKSKEIIHLFQREGMLIIQRISNETIEHYFEMEKMENLNSLVSFLDSTQFVFRMNSF
jgi:hypothetical protein